MAIAGFRAALRRAQNSTAFVDEACSQVSGNIYQITDAAKRVLDPESTLAVEENGVASTQVSSIDLLRGRITFSGAPSTPVTISGSYFPLDLTQSVTAEVIPEVVSTSITSSRDLMDGTVYGSGIRSRIHGLRDCSIDFTFLSHSGASVATALFGLTPETECVLDLSLPLASTSVRIRAYGLVESISPSASVDGRLEHNVSFKVDATKDTTYGQTAGFTIFEE